MAPDDDLDAMDRAALIDAARQMRVAIRAHRDATRHELCWHHPQLWDLLPDRAPPEVEVPEWPQFLRGCVKYRESLDRQVPQAPRISREYGEE